METDINDKVSNKSSAAAAHNRKIDVRSSKLIKCPFEVRIDGRQHDEFYDLRDAITSARTAKRDNPVSIAVVTDVRTGKLVFKVED